VTDLLDVSGPTYAKAMGHPTRHRLLLELGEDGATISQLANRLATNKGNVAHHLNVLVEAGLVRRGPTRTVRGGTEQYFVRTASRFQFEQAPPVLAAMMSNLTEELAADHQALLNHRILRLSRPQAAALAAHLDALVTNLKPASERERRYGVVVSVYRQGRNLRRDS
jgi:predicted ArsR family transcriptional regulator